MDITEFNEKIAILKKIKSEIGQDLSDIMNDETLSIDDRYEALLVSGLGKQSWRTNFDTGLDDSFLYESPLYMEKYETTDVSYILETLTEENLLSEEQIQKFKSYCVNGCYSTMKFDW